MTTTSLSTRRHESAHAAMAHWLDVRVNSISAVFDGTNFGEVRHAYCDVAKQILVILAALLEWPGDLPEWPISQYETADEQDLHNLITAHHISEEQYRQLTLIALTIASGPDYQRLLTITAAALRRQPVIDHDLFHEIAAVA